MLKNCYNTVEMWNAWNHPCLSSILIFFLQSVDTLHNSTERVHLLCTKPNHRRLFMFTAPRQQNNETKTKQNNNNSFVWEEKERWCMFEILWRFILNEAQWINFPSLVQWKTDTSRPLDFLFCAAADESRAGITQLQHSHLQIQGWQGSSASFNYEWQPFIFCLLIRWDDAICSHDVLFLFLFS